MNRVLKELREGTKRVFRGRVIQAKGTTSICLTCSRDSEVASMEGAERGLRDGF